MAPPTKDNVISNVIISKQNPTIPTISKQKTINRVITKFFINTLPTISGEPEYEFLNEIIQASYENSDTLPTTLAGRKHDHIGIILKENPCATLATGTPLEDPDDTDASPTITTNATFDHH